MSASGAQAAVPTGNLIQNPGADEAAGETDSTGLEIPHWFTSGDLSAVQYGSPVPGYPTVADSNAIGGGANFFSGGKNDPDMTSTAFQFIEIPGAASEIDAGRVSTTLSAYLGGKPYDNDTATVTASFEDEHSDIVFGAVQIGPVTAADRGTQTAFCPAR
jgi:hypothetical protein